MARSEAARPSPVITRVDHLIAAAVNTVLLGLVHLWPGWQVVPFLTADTRLVLGLVDLSLVAGIVANVAYLLHDRRWLVLRSAWPPR